MFDPILRRMGERIRTRQYVMTVHAKEEMDDEALTIFDIEHAVVTGKIVERQKDPDTGEWKYIVKGQTTAGDEVTTVTKLSLTGKLVMITV